MHLCLCLPLFVVLGPFCAVFNFAHLELDLNKVTVIVDKPERPVPLKQLGSGSNWVGVHLITFFALQRFFIGANRPVPRFLFFDQPSQVYFPSELDEKQIDWNEVGKMYRFIIDHTKSANKKSIGK